MDACWTDTLVPEMCEEIRLRVRTRRDIASAAALAFTCQLELALFHEHFVPYRKPTEEEECAGDCSRRGDYHLASHAAACGHIHLMEWAVTEYRLARSSRLLRSTVIAAAIRNGRLDVLDVYKDRCKPRNTERLEFLEGDAARAGQLDVLIWLETHWKVGEPRYKDVVEGAGSTGATHILQWVYDTNHDAEDIWRFAAEGASAEGRIDSLEWLHQHGMRFNSINFALAVNHQQKATLLWLLAHGCPRCRDAVASASRQGSLPFVQFVVNDLGCRIDLDDELPVDSAIISGNLAIVQWLHETLHCALGHSCLMQAAQCGRVHIFDWILARGIPMHEPGSLLAVAVTSRQIAFVEHVLALTPVLSRATCASLVETAMRGDHRYIARLLREKMKDNSTELT